MRLPERPPKIKHQQLIAALQDRAFSPPGGNVRRDDYLHWDKLRHLSPPAGLTHEQWWVLTKLGRQAGYRSTPLLDAQGRPFVFVVPDRAGMDLHMIDRDAAGKILMDEHVATSAARDRYVVSSLMEEAIRSSQIEGAAVTRQVAKEMLRTARRPKDKGERMIVNNYLAMQHIVQHQGRPLTRDLLMQLQRILTEGAADVPDAAGRLRRPGEPIRVVSFEGEVLHEPPPAAQLDERIDRMLAFANEGREAGTQTAMIHPVVRAIVLHFWLAYDHPFADGNGRTARALFYWSMLSAGYWLFEFVSISSQIRRSITQYGRAFLETETDENDLTYFLVYHLKVICQAIDELVLVLRQKTKRLQDVEARLRGADGLNHRQVAILGHALRHAGAMYTAVSHQRSHNVTNQTARQDLLDLAARGLLDKRKRGRQFVFFPSPRLEATLTAMGDSADA
ncbi:MAG: Fic family protein [Phycisphaerae bacterium]